MIEKRKHYQYETVKPKDVPFDEIAFFHINLFLLRLIYLHVLAPYMAILI